jgi:hypothetical protein
MAQNWRFFQVWAALNKAQMGEAMSALPEKLDTPVGEVRTQPQAAAQISHTLVFTRKGLSLLS